MSKTTVVYVTRDRYDVYIGHRRPGIATVDSIFAKPWEMGGDGREMAIIRFAYYWFGPENKDLRIAAQEKLVGRRIACWCHDESQNLSTGDFWCHGDIIAGYLNWKAWVKENNLEPKKDLTEKE